MAPVVALMALALATAATDPCPAVVPRRANLDLECSLPGGTELQITARAGQYLTIDCGDNGTYTCSEMPHMESPPAPPPSAGFAYCSLPDESLACTLESLGAPSVSSLTLREVPGGAAAQLLPKHVQGLMNLTTLSLIGSSSHGDVTPLPNAALAMLPALRRLTIRGANLRLTSDSLVNVTTLEFLEISASKLEELRDGALRGLSALRVLSLWGNELKVMQKGALDGLGALEMLDLSSNPLRTLGNGVLASAPRLRVLRLVDVSLEVLDEPVLSGLGALEDLMVLDAQTPLTVGSRALALARLRFVQIERCRLAALPEDALVGTRSLQALSLSHNALTALPPQLLRDAVSLRALNLSHNALEALAPALFAPLRRLEELNLNDNSLEEFPDELFATLGALRTLAARNNKLHTLAPLSMRGAGSLTTLDLAHNQLTLRADLPGGSNDDGDQYNPDFGPQTPLNFVLALRRLDLSHNLVRDVFSDWRIVLLHLELLNLTYNRVERLRDADFNFLSSDVVVDLRYNNITTVQLSEGSPLGLDEDGGAWGQSRVLLDGNPIECDCHAYSLLQRVNDTRARPRLDPGAVACAGPAALAGTPLLTVAPADLVCPLLAPDCPTTCKQCTLRPATESLELDCDAVPATAPDPREFGLSRTVLRLASAPPTLNLSMTVQELILSGLGMTRPPPGPASFYLELLDLSNNKLTEVPPPTGPQLRLAGNPLACDCQHAKSLMAIQRTPRRVLDWKQVKCARGGPLWRVDAARLCDGATAALAAGAGGALALIGLLAGVMAVLWLRYRREIKVFLYARGWCGWLTHAGDEPSAKYDVFVSFSHEDEALVAHELVPALERRGYALCVHYRDWAPGESIAAHVARSVREARRTLVVVSHGFLRSEWARAEFRTAHARALREGRARVVVVLLSELPSPPAEDDELHAYLRTNTYLKWGDPWFWEKLQYALPHRPVNAQKKGALTTEAVRTAIMTQPPDKLASPLEPHLAPPPAL